MGWHALDEKHTFNKVTCLFAYIELCLFAFIKYFFKNTLLSKIKSFSPKEMHEEKLNIEAHKLLD